MGMGVLGSFCWWWSWLRVFVLSCPLRLSPSDPIEKRNKLDWPGGQGFALTHCRGEVGVIWGKPRTKWI